MIKDAFQVCTIDLNHVSIDTCIKNISSIESPIVEILLGKEEESTILPLVEELHNAKKKVLLDTKNGALISKADIVFIHSPEEIEEESVFKILSKSCKPFFYRINKDLEETRFYLEKLLSFKKNYCLSKFSVLIWYDNKSIQDILSIEQKFGKDLDIVYIDLPECLAERYGLKGSYRSFLDVSETLEEDGVKSYSEQAKDLFKFYVKRKECLDCSFSSSCLGFIRNTNSEVFPIQEGVKKQCTMPLVYHSKELPNRVQADIYTYNGTVEDLTVEGRIGYHDIELLQNCRKGDLSDYDFYHIWYFERSMYFNRRTTPMPLFNHDPRGIDSIDMTFIGSGDPTLERKLKQDLLLPEHGLMILSKVFFKGQWSEEKMNALDDFTMSALKEIILENGGEESKLTQKGNDLMYNGKKFCGKEWKFLPPYAYIENTVLTTEYLPEKKWFDMLYHYDGEKQITGITEEVPTVTKELLATELLRKFKEKFNK